MRPAPNVAIDGLPFPLLSLGHRAGLQAYFTGCFADFLVIPPFSLQVSHPFSPTKPRGTRYLSVCLRFWQIWLYVWELVRDV